MGFMERAKRSRIIQSFKTVFIIVAILWIIFFISKVIPLNHLGIHPRSLIGLLGIFIAPFLHATLVHIINNSITLLILGSIFLTVENKLSLFIILHLIVIGGFGTWLIGRPNSVHIGASGVIYGILGYLIFLGIFTRNFKTIIISVVITIFYGGLIWGIFPNQDGVSWESHLCGFLAGIITARLYAKRAAM